MPTHILDLPVDLILLVLPHLDAQSFLRFTATCHALHDPAFVQDHTYWSALVRQDFRVPNQPVAANDGARWHKLYKRLRTQSRVYTWGNNERACLGHSFESDENFVRGPRRGLRGGPHLPVRRPLHRRHHIGWPGEMQGTGSIGVVSDLQCGGWSTTLLSAKGALYTVGVLDGQSFPMTTETVPTALKYPTGFVPPTQRYDATTAIRQFSSGRAHVLGLSDSGRIWSWQDIGQSGLHVKFLSHDTVENGKERGRNVVRKVMAGWDKSAALIEGTGIVMWEPLNMSRHEAGVADAALVMESSIVPWTGYTRRGEKTSADDHVAQHVGEVEDFIVLDHVILFNTSLGKVFGVWFDWSTDDQNFSEPVELHLVDTDEEPSSGPKPDATFVTSVQGSFRSFAIFTRSGAVYTSDNDRIQPILRNQERPSRRAFDRIPALQNNNVISVAFGDWHFHALHSTGHITSYGNEPQLCGALGLGPGNPEGRLRGIRNRQTGMAPDGRLVPHAYTAGRQVWFEEEKRRWIQYITSGGVDEIEAAERMRMALGSPGVACQGEVSEWIEQEGRDWEKKFGALTDEDDGLGAYFALSVTAAGWHSGALVLVNEDLAQRVREKCEVAPPAEAEKAPQEAGQAGSSNDEDATGSPPTPAPSTWTDTIADHARYFLGMAPYNAPALGAGGPAANRTGPMPPPGSDDRTWGAYAREGVPFVWAKDHFPRLRLADGTEMPGTVEFDTWRFGRPEFKLDEEEWV